jgi:hypothetical protein
MYGITCEQYGRHGRVTTNTAKYLTYTEAWRRIKNATAGGFYFEVVTICESIISDRIFSYVKGVNPASKANIKTPFERLISEWRTLAQGNLPQHGTSDLGQAVNSWRIERNAVVHGLAKSFPGAPTLPVITFLTRAQNAAVEGAALARSVSNWHKKQLTTHRRKQVASKS